jgi:hypothetical protein
MGLLATMGTRVLKPILVKQEFVSVRIPWSVLPWINVMMLELVILLQDNVATLQRLMEQLATTAICVPKQTHVKVEHVLDQTPLFVLPWINVMMLEHVTAQQVSALTRQK